MSNSTLRHQFDSDSKIAITVFDFTRNPWQGDPRQAHQLVPIIQEALDKGKVSYIFDKILFPDPRDPITEKAILKEEQDERVLIRQRYDDDLIRFNRIAQEWDDAVIDAFTWPDVLIPGRLFELGPQPARPFLMFPRTRLDKTMLNDIESHKRDSIKLETESKCAISIIRQFLGSQILSNITPALIQCGRSPRQQAIELFQYIKDHRIAQVTLRSDIDNDLTLIKKAESFSEALDIIGIVTQLNFELITMDPLFGKSDDELISCLISKMIAPCFQTFIMMVVGRNQISVDLPVLFAAPVAVANRQPKLNWSEFANLIKQYLNIDRQHFFFERSHRLITY